MMGDGGWWAVLGPLFWLLLFVAPVLAIVWLYKYISGRGASALEVLNMRYAKGGISKTWK